ncbi:large conductance mechanosensitive channel protein MscL [Armatimonas rosea]|uniref:Large-conductance mechanosensitive channel n=1 Tax=Armatimonas rosea TaxID=685828 RepID=A0A7W9SLL4_ARMRO|nr:large conductance mechanosensitive channel protein MscL [Armatimonas rosea]MBB6048891.1 large conductance mechanosensitive channel [Armatimonas rosea]
MSLIKEFREFVGSGNAVDLAVGVLAAGAMGKILQSFVDEMIIPLTGLLGKASWADSYVVLKGDVPVGKALAEARKIDGTVILGYGQFLTTAVNTLVLVFAVFMVVKAINAMKRKQAAEAVTEAAAAPPPAPPAQEVLLTEIRDLLKSR